MRPRIRPVLLACGFSLLSVAVAAGEPAPGKPGATKPATGGQLQPVRPWSAAGGVVSVRWNNDLARDLGIRILPGERLPTKLQHGADRFDLQPSGHLQFQVQDGYLRAFSGGALQARGGYVLALPGGTIALEDFRLVPRTAAGGKRDPLQLDLIGADGKAWFYVDRVMHELTKYDSVLAVRSSDLRISAQLARRLRQPEVAGLTIAEIDLSVPIQRKGSGAMNLADQIRWPGDPAPDGSTYQADLFMQSITGEYTRCQGCTGENGSGDVVLTPSSTLRNNVNEGSISATIPGDPLGTSSALWTASIPWYSKFSGNFPPYGNDQHPYLIWNMYRVNADDSIEQIGRSGVKQAFLTTNGGCLDANDHNSHVLGRGCTDTYSVGNNDFNNSLSPRSEILPATGQWGRCGSIFDPNCDGVGTPSPAPDNFYLRLLVDESQIAPSRNPGASWMFESWYLARQDINIYNSMATLKVTPQWTGNIWNFGNSAQKLGTAIDRWVGPTPSTRVTERRLNRELVADGAHAKVAVKVAYIGQGRWRYNYAVMNLDFAFAQTQGAEPNLRILSTQGFDGFGLAIAAARAVDTPVFRDGDLGSVNNWQFTRAGNAVKWTNGSSTQTSLGWGMLYSFSFTSTAAPAMGQATLFADTAPVPNTYTVETLVPGP